MLISRKYRKGERGQVLILCAICLVVLLLFVGLAIDFGMAYVTKARLGKAVDAAALTGARYSAQAAGETLADAQTESTALAQSSFAMNYVTSGLDAAVPVVNITYSFDPNNNTLVNVTATAKINTSFIGLLPAFKTLNVSATAQGKAARVEMTLVLDRSGSMGSDGGSTYLPGAVSNFTDRFDDGKDSASLVTFSTTATTDVSMRTGNFQSLIKNTANSLSFSGHTFSDAALQQAFTQENVAVTGNVQKSVVFFTDGGANTIQNNLTCGSGSTLATGIWNFGGQDPGANGKTPAQTAVGFMNPNTGAAPIVHHEFKQLLQSSNLSFCEPERICGSGRLRAALRRPPGARAQSKSRSPIATCKLTHCTVRLETRSPCARRASPCIRLAWDLPLHPPIQPFFARLPMIPVAVQPMMRRYLPESWRMRSQPTSLMLHFRQSPTLSVFA